MECEKQNVSIEVRVFKDKGAQGNSSKDQDQNCELNLALVKEEPKDSSESGDEVEEPGTAIGAENCLNVKVEPETSEDEALQNYLNVLIKEENNSESETKAPEVSKPRRTRANQRGHRNYSFRCEHCRLEFRDKNKLLIHMKSDHKNIVQKPKGGKRIRKKYKKGQAQSKYKTYACPFCEEVFDNRNLFFAHMYEKHPRENYECPQCNKTFKTWLGMQNHEKYIHSTKRFLCTDCDSVFKMRSNLEKHRKNVHSNEMYGCEMCGKAYKSESYLAMHRKIVHDEEQQPCPMCDKVFKSKRYLTGHMKDVHSKDPHKCELCGEVCRSKTKLVKHMRWKHTPGSYECAPCGKTFESRHHLALHAIETHPGKDFKCAVCPKSFKWQTSLNIHIKCKHSTESFACPHCCNYYTTDKYLQRHIRQKHPEVVDTQTSGFGQMSDSLDVFRDAVTG